MRTRLTKPISDAPIDAAGLTGRLHRYLIWMETPHYAEGTATIRHTAFGKFILCSRVGS